MKLSKIISGTKWQLLGGCDLVSVEILLTSKSKEVSLKENSTQKKTGVEMCVGGWLLQWNAFIKVLYPYIYYFEGLVYLR